AAQAAATESGAQSPPAAARPPPSGAHPTAGRPTPGSTPAGAESRQGAAPRRQGRWTEPSGRPTRGGGSSANAPRRHPPGRPAPAGGGPAPGNVREREPERGRRGPIVDPRQRPRREDAASQPYRVGGARVAVGTISELSRDRGFGFLVDGAGRKRFFHRSAVV